METAASAVAHGEHVASIALTRVESSRIHSIGHRPESNTLAIRFLAKDGTSPGSLYYYSQFTAADYEAFSNAESIGSHFAKNIKPYDKKYPYQKIDESTPQV